MTETARICIRDILNESFQFHRQFTSFNFRIAMFQARDRLLPVSRITASANRPRYIAGGPTRLSRTANSGGVQAMRDPAITATAREKSERHAVG
jgi:hypothetical protein